MAAPIKNYTSEVPASRSIARIEDVLMQNGARQILKDVNPDTRDCEGLAFIITVAGTDTPFRLPSRVDRVEEVLRKSRKYAISAAAAIKIRAQAQRTAWKILSDWVDAQMALVKLQQVEVCEVFLPYVYDVRKQKTFYEQIAEDGFKALEDRR